MDVGCGSKTKHNYLKGNNIIHVDIDKTADADLFMDINLLGFESKSFDVVHASHVLEHIINPNIAVREMKRVSRKYIIIKVPNATYFKLFNERSDHMFSWTLTTFENFLKCHFRDVKVYGNKHRVQEVHSKLGKLKLLVLSLILGDDELIAVCSLRKTK